MKSFEDSLSLHIYNTCKSSLEKVAGSDADLRHKVDIEFNNFLQLIHKKIGKIINYIDSEGSTKPKIIRASTNNFIFTFTIYPNKSSEIEIATINRYGRQYQPDFLLSKVKPRSGFVYFVKSEYGYKIGCTSNLQKRINAFGVKLPFKTELHSYIECKKYEYLESTLHKLLDHRRLEGEWFKLKDLDFREIDILVGNMGLNRTING